MDWKLILFLFLGGMVEDFIASISTTFLVQKKRIECAITSFLNIILYAYVISAVVDSADKFYLIFAYASGVVVGTLLSMEFTAYLDKLARSFSFKFKKPNKKIILKKKIKCRR